MSKHRWLADHVHAIGSSGIRRVFDLAVPELATDRQPARDVAQREVRGLIDVVDSTHIAVQTQKIINHTIEIIR